MKFNKIDFFLNKLILSILITLIHLHISQKLHFSGDFVGVMADILILHGGLLNIILITSAISTACNVLKYVGISILKEKD